MPYEKITVGNTAVLKAGVIEDANKFAERQGKVAIPLSINETPVYPGHFATVEYQFRVVDRNDPEAKRTHLVLRPDFVIDKSEEVTVDINKQDKKIQSQDIYTELIKLEDLRQKKIITEEEFLLLKKKLINAE